MFEADANSAREKYPEVFYYYDGLLDVAISQSMHPAGIVASPITLRDNYGTFVSDGKEILQIDMDCVHEVSLVKYDILGLKNIEIIKDAYELLGEPYPKSHEINWNDEAVWKDMLEHYPEISRAQRSGGKHVFLVLEPIELHPNARGNGYPAGEDKRKQKRRDHPDLACKMQSEQCSDYYKRHPGEYIGYALQQYIDHTAVITLHGTVKRAYHKVDKRNKNGKDKAEARTGSKA